jgi:5'(3')-deoxyribonucleotidase
MSIVSDRIADVKDKQRLFIDMDGTLAVFQKIDTLETLYEKNYFLNLKPIDNVLSAVKDIIKNHPEIEVNILSSVLSDSKYALAEKNEWLDKYLPEIDANNRTFPPCGGDKKLYVKGGVKNTDFLLDDYTQNLYLWQPPAKGIKILNGINHTKGTWQYDRLRNDKPFQELAKDIVSIMKGRENIIDDITSGRADTLLESEVGIASKVTAAKIKADTQSKHKYGKSDNRNK